jgi:hypothetical protein
MVLVRANRLRILILLLALTLLGQGFVPAAMAMQPQNALMAGMPAASPSMCPDCGGMDHSKTMPSTCAIGVCAAVVGVLPAVVLSALQPLSSSYVNVADNAGQGIAIPPPLGPPRPLHLT